MSEDSFRDRRRARRVVDPYAESVPEPEVVTDLDVGAVSRDEAFVTQLSQGRYVASTDPAERELAGLIAGWRSEALTGPVLALPEPPQIDEAIAADELAAKRAARGRAMRLLAGAAAVVFVAFAGMLVIAQGAEPGDPLWTVKKVVFADEAEQTEARVAVQNDLEIAQSAIAEGDYDEGSRRINRAEDRLGPVRDPATVEEMKRWIEQLRESTDAPAPEQPAPDESTDPSAPSSEPESPAPTEPSTSETPSSSPESSAVPSSPPVPSSPASTSVPVTTTESPAP